MNKKKLFKINKRTEIDLKSRIISLKIFINTRDIHSANNKFDSDSAGHFEFVLKTKDKKSSFVFFFSSKNK